MKITRKHITFKLEYKEREYPVYIPFVRYEMFKDIYLVFNYIYELLIRQKLDPFTFCTDLEAYIIAAVEQNYPNADRKEKIEQVERFFQQSFLGAYVLDSANNYEPVLFDNFLHDEEECEDFLTEAKGFYIFFYAVQRYLKKRVETLFKESYTLLSATELQKSFMNSISSEVSTQEKQKMKLG